MRIVISGSKGFIGRNLLSILSNKNYSIFTIDIEDGYDLSRNKILNEIPDFDVFVHLANLSYVPDSYTKPIDFYKTNYLTTLNALELCRKNNAKLIYISSYVYGQPEYLPIDEKHSINPFNPYAQSKLLSEILCDGYLRDFNIETIILRPFNVYGIGQKGKLLIPEIFQQLAKGSNTINLKDPFPRRDYINVIDVVNAIKKSIDAKICGKYNICSGISYSVKEVTEIINSCLIKPVKFTFSNTNRINEVNETVGSYMKIQRDLNWKPTISFEEGIKSLVEYNKL